MTLDRVQSGEGGTWRADRIAVVARPTAPMSRAWSVRLALLGAFVLAACFSEADIDPGGQDSTGGPMCVDGAVGCACYGNGTCDPGLQCAVDLQRCIPEDCTPGEAACVCAEGRCDAPSECNSGICEGPGGDDADDGGASTTSVGGTDDGPGPTSGTVDDTGSDDDASTSGPGTSTGPEPSTSDSGGPVCDELAECGACFDCVETPESDCAVAHQTCSEVAGCTTAVACLTDCGLTGACFEDCCDGLDPGQLDAVGDLMFCRTDHCTSSCARFEIPTCG